MSSQVPFHRLKRERVTWVRWDPAALRQRTSRRWVWIVTEADGYERVFDTKGEAEAWIAQQEAEAA